MIEYRFLLVSLSIDAILGETTIHRRKEKLKQMSSGQGVGDVYAATLERIRAQNKDRARLGMEAIMWVAHSERPLQPDELCQALGQCSQPSGAPVGPGGGTAKSPGRDGTAKRSPSSSFIPTCGAT